MILGRRRLRFSLRSLLLAVLLAGSGMVLWMNWKPWVFQKTIEIKHRSDGSKIRYRQQLSAIAFSPDQRTIAVGGWDGTVRIVNFETGLEEALLIHDSAIEDIVFSEDGRQIRTSTGRERSRYVWDIHGTVIDKKPWVSSISPDGFLELQNSPARIVDVVNGVVRMQFDKEYGALFSPDGSNVLTLIPSEYRLNNKRSTGVMKLRDARTGAEVARATYLQVFFQSYESGAGATILFSRDGKRVLLASDDTPPQIWDVASDKVTLFSPDPEHCHDLCATFSADMQRVTTNHGIWDISSGRNLSKFSELEGSMVFAFSPDDTYLAASEETGVLMFYSRRRPEYWWGLAWLPEFWLTVVFTLAMFWSLRRDWREARA